ncbi:MAG TPA: molybdopterin cofactor-binding domain-containing protein [Acidimicrobiia bacterium]|nr:molybdopterin cofactor-binding domain-containing protein [Acidimicrobiia bacterium]
MTVVKLLVNGQPVEVHAPPLRRLTDVLRDDLGLTATKVGCEAGDCGACSILLDNEVVNGCTVPIGRLNGHEVMTLEGLDAAGRIERLQQSFLHHGAAQCGICTPGMLVAAAGLLATNPTPDEQAVMDGLGGVLCRCTGYRKIIDAVVAAPTFDEEPVRAPEGKAVGQRVARVDGVPKVKGTDIFGADGFPSDALVARVIRSPYPRAAFEFGDLDAFVDSHEGLVAVFTAKDIPGRNWFGVIAPLADQPVFAERETRYRGESVAMVVGEPEAMEALDLSTFPVVWQELAPLMSPEEALSDGAPLLHPSREQNVLIRGLVERGDLEAAFATADTIVEGEFATGFIEHAYIEPEAGFARRLGNRLEVHVTTQTPHMDLIEVAEILALDPAQVRIVPTAVGGGFGGKLDLSLQPFLALAAWRLDRPVRMTYTRPESMMSTTKRHPAQMKVRVGASAEGKLVAMDFEATFNTGAYSSWGPTVANRVPVHAGGPYLYEAYRARTAAVHTNCPPSGAFRGFGVPQAAIAQECVFDEVADALGSDRLEFRLRNALTARQPTVTGQIFEAGVGYVDCLEALRPVWKSARAEAASFNERADGKRRGVGVAGLWYGCGNTALPNPSTIKVGLDRKGRVVLFQGAVDIGQGANTVISQICADAVGVPLESVIRIGADTDTTPDAGKTSASRQTYVSGNAAFAAGQSLRRQLLALVGASEESSFEVEGADFLIHDRGEVKRIDLSTLPAADGDLVAVAVATYDPPTTPLDEKGQGEPYAVFGFGAQLTELEVDLELGTVRLLKITAAHDVGRAVNPGLLEGQIEGGIAQGIGLALMEEYIPGRTENLHDYLIPTIGDVPEVVSILVESNDPRGPYGAKGIGEHSLIPTAPSILNALRDAIGVGIRKLPATPDRVLAAIRSAPRLG